MVRCGGASCKGEFGQCGGSRSENIIRLEARPDRVEGLEPVEEIGILCGRDGAREGLVEVMVRVDQPRHENVTAEIEDFISGTWEISSFTNLFDEAIANKKTTFRKLGLVVVHGEDVGVLDE